MLGRGDGSRYEERTENMVEKWITDSGDSFDAPRSADLLSNVRMCYDKAGIGNNHVLHVQIVEYGTLTAYSYSVVDLTVTCLMLHTSRT